MSTALTVQALEQSFKELMRMNTFEKITISDITQRCGVNRQTFYYHFQDKYELLNHIYKQEIIEPFTKELSFDNWNENLYHMFVTMQQDRIFYKNAFLHSNEEFSAFLFQMAVMVFQDATNRLQLKLNRQITREDEAFISAFFAYGITGMILEWVRSGMKDTPQELAMRLEHLVEDCHKISIERYLGTI